MRERNNYCEFITVVVVRIELKWPDKIKIVFFLAHLMCYSATSLHHIGQATFVTITGTCSVGVK